jgi:cephalosporin hydroxylase
MNDLLSLNNYNGKYLTDKGVLHSYLPFYENLFWPLRNKKINIFEVGFQYGGSCKLWEAYFPNAIIKSIDIDSKIPFNKDEIIKEWANKYNIVTELTFSDRVKMEYKDVMTLNNDYFFDFIPDIAIDDGSHELEHQLHFLKVIYPVLKKGGILIVEDIQDISSQRKEFEKLDFNFEIIDFRESGRSDDVILIFRK